MVACLMPRCPEHPEHEIPCCTKCQKLYPCPRDNPECHCSDVSHRKIVAEVESKGDAAVTFHRQKLPEGDYLILSLKWSRAGVLSWWGPDNSGYTTDIDKAGRYSAELVRRKQSYYNDEITTRAILASKVLSGNFMPVTRVIEAYLADGVVSA